MRLRARAAATASSPGAVPSADGSGAATDSQRGPLAVWIVPYAAALFLPSLWYTKEGWPHALNATLFGWLLVFTALPSIALVAWLSRGFRTRVRWSLGVGMIVSIATFQWPTFTRTGEALSEMIGTSALEAVVPVALAGSLIWIAARRAHDLPFALIAGTGVLATAIGMGILSFSLVVPGPGPAAPTASDGDLPDVVLIVLDGHARADWFSELNIDGGTLPQDLEQRGFTVAPAATANYNHTNGSVASMLNLDYVFDEGPITNDERELMRSSLLGATGIFAALREKGYETAYVENVWAGSQCGPAVDRCIRDEQFRSAGWILGQMTILAPVFRQFMARPFNESSLDQLERLSDYLLAGAASDRPQFTYAHFMAPHPPFLFNEDCSRHGEGPLTGWDDSPELLEPRLENLAAQTRCVNTIVIEAVDRLLAAAPDTLVMITSDHGPRTVGRTWTPLSDVSPTGIRERMRVLSAYLLPHCSAEIRSDITPVNGTRSLVNCALGMELRALPDDNLWLPHDTRGAAVDVSGHLEP